MMETHIFASHGLEHLLKLHSELLNVIDYDTWLGKEREIKRLYMPNVTPFSALLQPFYCYKPKSGKQPFLIASLDKKKQKNTAVDAEQEKLEFSVITAPLGVC